jgi:hypothetical protein
VQERDVQALQTGDNNDWDFFEVIRLPLDGIQDPSSPRVVSRDPPPNPAIESPGLPVDAGESFLDLRVSDYYEFPTLGVAAGRRSYSQVYQAKDYFIIHRIRLQTTDRPLRPHGLIERHSEVHMISHHFSSWLSSSLRSRIHDCPKPEIGTISRLMNAYNGTLQYIQPFLVHANITHSEIARLSCLKI